MYGLLFMPFFFPVLMCENFALPVALTCGAIAALITPAHAVEENAPLGEQGGRVVGSVKEWQGFPSAAEFGCHLATSGDGYGGHNGSRPAVFRQGAADWPASTLWTDEYLSSQHGALPLFFEVGKKEDRGGASDVTSLSTYLSLYDELDMYAVQGVLPAMQRDLRMPESLRHPSFVRGYLTLTLKVLTTS